MTNETKTNNNAIDNKSLLGPLGKYAVIAVIMVSIIVTTAIMLDKQLSTVDEQIAAIESEVSKLTQVNTATSNTIESSASTTAPISAETKSLEIQNPTILTKDTAIRANSTEAPSTEVATVDTETTATEIKPETLSAISAESTNKTEPVITNQTTADQPALVQTIVAKTKTEAAITETQVQDSPFAMEQQGQTHLETFKLEQKQRMTDMFARIKALEAQQLNQYKSNQDQHVARMRDQIVRQQEIIETLILRNKDIFELRAANVQRIQTNREEVLNRI